MGNNHGELNEIDFVKCLNKNFKYENKRFIVQIKWYSLFDDIIRNMNDKVCSLMVEEYF